MRHLFMAVAVVLASAALATADSVEVKGPHICCPQCVTAVNKLLAKVDGVSDVKPDAKTKTVTFTAKDAASANAGIKALITGGFSGKATVDGKEVKVDLPAVAKGAKAETVTVKDVHVCCKACQNAINGAFKGSTVKYEGSGAQRTVIVSGGDLYPGSVIETLRKAGFNGTVEK